jgi:hypothetical protein
LYSNFREKNREITEHHCKIETLREKTRSIKEVIDCKKRQESAQGLKHDVTEEDIGELNQEVDILKQKKSDVINKYRNILQFHEDKFYYFLKINKKYEEEIKRKKDEDRLVRLKIKEFKRIMEEGNKKDNKKRKVQSQVRAKPKKKPAKNIKKFKPVEQRSNSSRKTLDDTFKFEDTDSNYLGYKKTQKIPAKILNQRVDEEDDDYGSDFSNLDQSSNVKKAETQNIKFNHEYEK